MNYISESLEDGENCILLRLPKNNKNGFSTALSLYARKVINEHLYQVSVAQMTKETGVSRGTIGIIRNGKQHKMKLDTFLHLMAYLRPDCSFRVVNLK